jgi:hypothetical protein
MLWRSRTMLWAAGRQGPRTEHYGGGSNAVLKIWVSIAMESAMPSIIVERGFDPPFTQDDLDAVSQRIGGCLKLYRVRWIRSHFSTDRRWMVCEYEAADAQSVPDVQNAAQASFERVWAAEIMASD